MDQNVLEFYQKSLYYTDIPNPLFKQFNVKKGLRNEDGTGVCVGLTKISDVVGYKRVDGEKQDDEGKLFYRGMDVRDIINGRKQDQICGYEETCFLLLFGFLPNEAELQAFRTTITTQYELPEEFLEMNILRMPSYNLMNQLQQSVLALYNFDENPDDTSIGNTLRQGIDIMAKLSTIICYAYQSKIHHFNKASLHIHYPRKDLSIAENILHMLRPDSKFTIREAQMLDLMLILHADHGGGNNSTFTNVVISSTGTDIYSTIIGAIGSLKGPRHGGANIQVSDMMKVVQAEIGLTSDEWKVKDVIHKLLSKQLYDKSGLVYGIGHAVYTLSDPRSEILKEHCFELALEKHREAEFALYRLFEKCAKEVMFEVKGIHVSSNVDFYSGLVYNMMDIPEEVYTPLFVCARMVGWLAHNMENKLYDGRIMRPATKYVGKETDYIPMEKR